MSQRAKRPNRSDDGSVPVKRRKRTTAEEEEAAAAWQPRSNDLKSIYNRSTTEAPAELFRKDLISAMKLPDSEPLAVNEYWVIVDQWKQEWERGVQVPVNPDSLPEPSVSTSIPTIKIHEFKLPKNKYIRITKDEQFKVDDHALSNAPAQAEAACSYDLDECDVAYLKIFNAERAMSGQNAVNEDQLERVIEQFELTCWDKIQGILRNEEGLGIEYDENVICDVCRSPDSEEGNEMVFCDSCNICVHQACYGITRIPEGQWLCCTCNLSKRPKCVLCPNKGGAMKCTRSGQKWAHVSCALWIPEVSIGCVEKMEPITKISSIPQSRWALICVLCRERVGACIQCSVKTCKTAYHVTCAFKHGLEMRAIIEDENADDGVKLRSYCEKHSKSSKKEKSVCSGSEDDDSKRKKRKDMTSEEKNQARAARLQEIEAEFYNHVSIKDVTLLDVDSDTLHFIYNYWKLKRKAGNNKPLLPPKSEDVDVLSHKREQADLEKMKMFVQLRQDLERVRNLCYMVSRREKLSRSFFRLREQTFHKQLAVLSTPSLPPATVEAVSEANHGPSIYDRLYSHKNAEEHEDFDAILARIAGDDDKLLNGALKDKNPYKKVYFNGTSKRRSLYSSSSSDEKPKLGSSSEDEKPPSTSKKKLNNNNNKRHTKNRLESSSEDEDVKKNWCSSRSRLVQVERELGYSGSDSDELMPISQKTDKDTKTISSIYSDSDSSDLRLDSQQKLRTKAAVKEFSHKPSTSKDAKKKIGGKVPEAKNFELFVPQRQAAKKASENLAKKSNENVKPVKPPVKEPPPVQEEPVKVVKEVKEVKPKVKAKPVKAETSDLEKDLETQLAYVPQRQAAKKAAEHIKSGMGKQPQAPVDTTLEKASPPDPEKKPAVAALAAPVKKDPKSSSSSSSSSSTSSSSSSSSSSDSDSNPPRSENRDVSVKRSSNPTNTTTNNAKTWPFLDKVTKSAASSSDSSDSSPTKSASQRAESKRRRKIRTKSGRDADVRPRNLSDGQRGDVERERITTAPIANEKDNVEEEKQRGGAVSVNVLAPIKAAQVEVEVTNLEKEILERKAGKQGTAAKTKSTLDRLFGAEKKTVNHKAKSPVKENKPPPELEQVQVLSPKKSPKKSPFIEEHKAATPKYIEKIEPMEILEQVEERIEPPERPKSPIKEQNRSIFSPPHIKDTLLDFDNIDDGFGIVKDEDMIKNPLTFNFGNTTLFKEDSKEDSARETLNLVEKLRLELSKKSTSCDVDDGTSISSSSKNESSEFSEQVVPNSIAEVEETKLQSDPEVTKIDFVYIPEEKSVVEEHGVSSQGDERWVPPSDGFLCVQKDVKEASPTSLRISAADPVSMDCMPSPYGDVHPQAKWADSEIMPNRRSSSSSAASTSSTCSRREDEPLRPDMLMVNHPALDNLSYLSFATDGFPAFSEASQFVPPVSLFPAAPNYPVTTPGMFPPAAFGAPFPAPHAVLPALPKTVTETVPYSNVAFTASQHNLALTAAMVNMPKDLELGGESPAQSIKSNSSGKKSPTKPTRSSTRVTNKSPGSVGKEVKPVGRGRGEPRRNSVKGNQARGRGRGRGRGREPTGNSNTIHNKLVGTVFDLDFDDDADKMTDLKSMRERRKSIDERKIEVAPLDEPLLDIVEPVLPGPVDMRTYNAGFEALESDTNVLGAFEAPPAHEEIDEEFEKELQTALTAPKIEEPPTEVSNIKVSLSDSRNQLKVKIKGPIANYASTAPPPPAVDPVPVSNNVINNAFGGSVSGTSNLRRMRKKELLRQYWTQENMDDSSSTPGVNTTPAMPPVSRTIITIPKAVASMTSIPTKDDYRDYRTGDDAIEQKVKAKPRPLTRELRQLEVSLDDDVLDRRRNNNLDASKRRGRPPRTTTTPKLKIKIGSNSIVDEKRIRPPKKRLTAVNMPSVEDLRRESMKFRKLVMADFGKKKDKSEKRKKKKAKAQVQIISSEGGGHSSTKLIIRIAKKEEGGRKEETPIKLKLARCQEGSGYVMKQPPSAETKEEEAQQPGEPPPVPPPLAAEPLPLNKDCEVR